VGKAEAFRTFSASGMDLLVLNRFLVTDFKTNWLTATELLAFAWRGKRWWLTPIIVVLLVVSAVAPFIYALF
jgi:hypothetical protein